MRNRNPIGRRNARLYIARRGTRRVANAAQIESFLTKRGFTIHTLDDSSIDQQIDLFSEAEWVVAPHGAELGNLLFCAPGTKVLELSPDVDFKPYFSYMCNKLALTHGVLPCATTDGGFNTDMTVNMEEFSALFRMLRHRL
jgi:capsular polysaccharide biosynthesis protein